MGKIINSRVVPCCYSYFPIRFLFLLYRGSLPGAYNLYVRLPQGAATLAALLELFIHLQLYVSLRNIRQLVGQFIVAYVRAASLIILSLKLLGRTCSS